jgi:hypothetical protein
MTILDDIVVRRNADLETVWRTVMGAYPPGLRSVWMLLLDDEGRLRPVAVPIDGMPSVPDPALTEGLAVNLRAVRKLGDPVLLFSRPGPSRMTEADRQWGRVLTQMSRWAVYLFTPSGLHVFTPDDLVTSGRA